MKTSLQFIIVTIVLAGLGFPVLKPNLRFMGAVIAQEIESAENLANVNWDTEESDNGATNLSSVDWDEEESGVEENGLTGMNWDEEESENEGESDIMSESWEDEDAKEIYSDEENENAARRAADIRRIEDREQSVHVTGFALFIIYLLGGVLTAYITRNRVIALKYPPELLILLHSVWPIELLLFPLIGKKVK